MDRVLVLLRGSPANVDLRRRLDLGGLAVAAPYEVAVCHVLAAGHDGLEASLRAQETITAALRRALGEKAEAIAVLVASEAPGAYTVEDCARDWGATLVVA